MTGYYLATEDQRKILTEDDRQILLFESGASIFYRLTVDWNGDKVLDGDSEAGRLLRYSVDRGRDRVIGAPGGAFEPLKVGRLTIDLDNFDGRFDPWNVDGDLYGLLMPNKMIQLSATVPIESSTDVTTEYLFSGFITNITQNGYNKTATITAEDGFGYLSDRNVYTHGSIFPNTEQALGYIIRTTCDYPYPSTNSSTDDPFGFPYYYFANNLNCLRAIEDLGSATLGRISCRGDGDILYKSNSSTDAAMVITDSDVLTDISLSMPWENMRDNVFLEGIASYEHSSSTDGTADYTVYSSTETFTIPGEDTYELFGKFTYDGETVDIVGGSGYSYTEVSGSTDLLISDINFISDGYPMKIANSSTADGVIKDLTVTSKPYITNPLTKEYGTTSDNTATVFKWKSRLHEILREVNAGENIDTAQTEADIARLDDIGNTMVNYLSTPKPMITVQMQGRPWDQLTLDVEDAVTVTLATMGIDDTYRICGLSHMTLTGVQDILSVFHLYPIIERST